MQTHKGENKKETTDEAPTHRGLRTWSGTQYKVNRVYSDVHPLIGQQGYTTVDDILHFDGINKEYGTIRIIELIEI